MPARERLAKCFAHFCAKSEKKYRKNILLRDVDVLLQYDFRQLGVICQRHSARVATGAVADDHPFVTVEDIELAKRLVVESLVTNTSDDLGIRRRFLFGVKHCVIFRHALRIDRRLHRDDGFFHLCLVRIDIGVGALTVGRHFIGIYGSLGGVDVIDAVTEQFLGLGGCQQFAGIHGLIGDFRSVAMVVIDEEPDKSSDDDDTDG